MRLLDCHAPAFLRGAPVAAAPADHGEARARLVSRLEWGEDGADGWSLLLYASLGGELAATRALLADSYLDQATVRTEFAYFLVHESTALIVAMRYGWVNVSEVLLDAKANVEAQNAIGWDGLANAAMSHELAVVTWFLKRFPSYAHLNRSDMRNASMAPIFATIIHYSAEAAPVGRALLSAGADPFNIGPSGNDYWTQCGSKLDIDSSVIRMGLDIRIAVDSQRSYPKPDVAPPVRLIGTSIMMSFMSNAWARNASAAVKQYANYNGSGMLHWAAKKGDTMAIKTMLMAAADVSLRTDTGYTARELAREELGELPAALAVLLPEQAEIHERPYSKEEPAIDLCSFNDPRLRLAAYAVDVEVAIALWSLVQPAWHGELDGLFMLCGTAGPIFAAGGLFLVASACANPSSMQEIHMQLDAPRSPDRVEAEGPLHRTYKSDVPSAGNAMTGGCMELRSFVGECSDGDDAGFEDAALAALGGRGTPGLMCSCASLVSPGTLAAVEIFDTPASQKAQAALSGAVLPRTRFEKTGGLIGAFF